MSKEAFGVDRDALISGEIIPPLDQTEGKATFIPIEDWRHLYRSLHLMARQGYYRERHDGEMPAEKDPSFQQIIMHGFVIKEGESGKEALVYKRGEEEYSESRLRGKFSLGLGGHMERDDSSMIQAFYRELGEEMEIYIDGELVNLSNEEGKINPVVVKKYVSITPVGIIKDDRDKVGEVHLGIACRMEPKSKGVSIGVNRKEGEAVSYQYLASNALRQLIDSEEIQLEGWGQMVFENCIEPFSSKN